MTPPDAVAETLALRPALTSGTTPRVPGRGPVSTFRKYFKIFRASLVERMAYRGDFLLGTLLRFMPMITTILLWQAVYAGSGSKRLGNFSFHETIAYLLLTHISRMFSSMPDLAGGIAREVREGTLKRYLIQPVDLIGYLLSYRVAHKVAYIVTSVIPYAILFFLCRRFFDGLPNPWTFLGFLVSLVLGFLVGFFFEACVGMVAFWMLEVTSVLYIVMTLTYFVSGQMFPLDMLPQPWAGLLKVLPFQYMAYFPAVVFLGKVQGMDLVYHLLGELFWALFFLALARTLYRFGLRRYSAFGG